MSSELVDLVRELVKIESPSGREAKVSGFCRDWMGRHGFDQTYIDDYGSAIGVIHGHQKGQTLLLDGHLDTVEPGDLSMWSRDPFGGELIDGRIYGRGASDMKGAFGAMMFAASRFAPLRSRLKGTVIVTGSTWEEPFEGYALGKIIERLEREALRPGLVIIGEASDLTLKIGQRGRAEIVVRTLGKSVHASNPHLGVNAVYSMQAFIEDLRALEPREDPLLGQGIYEVTDIISSPYPGASVVPAACRITIDRRVLTGETEETVLDPLRNMVRLRQKKDPHFKADVFIETGTLRRPDGQTEAVKRFFPAWKLEPDDPVVKLGVRALQTVGLSGQVGYYAFCTNGSHSAGIAKIPTLGFGPSPEHLAHVADEYIAVSDLEKACEGYQALIHTYLMA